MKLSRPDNRDVEPALCARYPDHIPEVLIVDDDPNVVDFLQQFLEDEGFSVACECDGHSALRHIERQPPDLVLTDIRMPKLDGIGLLKEIHTRWQGIDVILMSGSETPFNLQVPLIKKPFDLDDILATICNYPG